MVAYCFMQFYSFVARGSCRENSNLYNYAIYRRLYYFLVYSKLMGAILLDIKPTDLFLFNDTETTGFCKNNGSVIQDGQARVCSIGLILTDARGVVLTEFSTLVRPDGWTISEGAQKVNGLATDQCEKYGLHVAPVLSLYNRLASMATYIVAHNSDFDSKMMEIEQAYYNKQLSDKSVPLAVKTPWYCTMKNNIYIHGGKGGTLAKNVAYWLNREPTNAHNAMGDAIDCKDIFFAMHGVKKAS